MRPRPIDLIVGRSTGLGSALFAPVYWPAAPVVNFLDYFYHAHRHDLAEEAGPETAPAYFHWRRSMAAIELLDLEQTSLGWTPTHWQRDLFPAEYRDEFLVLHDGVDTRRFVRSAWHAAGTGPRSIAGRIISDETRVISFAARSLDRLRGFDRFLAVANALLRARADVLCVVVGDPIVRRGLDVEFHNRDYPAHLMAQQPPSRSRSALVPGAFVADGRCRGSGRQRFAHCSEPALPGRPLAAGGDGGGLCRLGLRHRSAPRSRRARPNRSSGRRSRQGWPGAPGAGRARGPRRVSTAG